MLFLWRLAVDMDLADSIDKQQQHGILHTLPLLLASQDQTSSIIDCKLLPTVQGENGKLPNAKDAQQWIEAWKEKQPTGR